MLLCHMHARAMPVSKYCAGLGGQSSACTAASVTCFHPMYYLPGHDAQLHLAPTAPCAAGIPVEQDRGGLIHQPLQLFQCLGPGTGAYCGSQQDMGRLSFLCCLCSSCCGNRRCWPPTLRRLLCGVGISCCILLKPDTRRFISAGVGLQANSAT